MTVILSTRFMAIYIILITLCGCFINKPALPKQIEITPSPDVPLLSTSHPVILQGRLFFDIDLSGTQNIVPFRYSTALIQPFSMDKTQNPDLVRALETYRLANPDVINNQVIDLPEPGLSNIEVCASNKKVANVCVLTDKQGNFFLSHPLINSGDPVGLTFTDKNIGAFQKMAFQNRYVKPVTVPPYEMNGIRVPKQNLTQTHLMKITNTYYVIAGEGDIQIGLLQGVLPYPLVSGNSQIRGFSDHDPRTGFLRDWRGKTVIVSSNGSPQPDGIVDNLKGVDISSEEGSFVYSAGFGMATIRKIDGIPKEIIVMVDNYPGLFEYSHLDTLLISGTQEVFAGMIIGTIGKKDNESGAPYFHLEIGNSGIDPFGHPEGKYEQLWTRAFSPLEFP